MRSLNVLLFPSMIALSSLAFSQASSYFHLPIDEDEDEDQPSHKHIQWTPNATSTHSTQFPSSSSSIPFKERQAAMNEVLSNDDLYRVLGIQRSKNLDKLALRRAYLRRSKACHPDKFPNDPEATKAFQKVSVAYDILSKPSSKRLYDSRPTASFDCFAARPSVNPEETFRGVIIGVFNDFLDGDLEVIRTLLRAINDINPALHLGDEGIDSVLLTLQSIRDRALTCRTFIFALHAELTRLLEVQHAFRQLSYFDLMGRSRLTIQLTRITLSLPIALERAMQEQSVVYGHRPDSSEASSEDKRTLLPSTVNTLIKGVDVVLERMERILG
ncbi:hypothetical protein PLICRDRAFT_46354 [Plicaturopsis crispa FD-325 SS-3]|uniref:J domain-containing protein n=1 Tax=Plicaturopsis crispa FD-325 SS-3 TaxID=944288 RepID=A0A0C9T8C6_PLICR|nr:hypothetical protein PLICRDRAFT_46354 [Plicaturopsis crispa FD-325 SS-3]